MKCDADIVVVGGGPAGAAAAICAAQVGFRVTVLERSRFPRHRPGETLHPGVESLMATLGVADAVVAASPVRHHGIEVRWGTREVRAAFGRDESGPWRGFQVDRARLDAILLTQARTLGADIRQPAAAGEPLFHEGRIHGVSTDHGPVFGRILIDASGAAAWLARHLPLRRCAVSPVIRARYGYCRAARAEQLPLPRLAGDRTGWTWTAQVAPKTLVWMSATWLADQRVKPPRGLADMMALGATRGADVTWRRLVHFAGPEYLVAGDAAAALDPTSSHGVLRALMSGMMASHQACAALRRETDSAHSAARYDAWLSTWVDRDLAAMTSLYRELVPTWPTAEAASQPSIASKEGVSCHAP